MTNFQLVASSHLKSLIAFLIRTKYSNPEFHMHLFVTDVMSVIFRSLNEISKVSSMSIYLTKSCITVLLGKLQGKVVSNLFKTVFFSFKFKVKNNKKQHA